MASLQAGLVDMPSPQATLVQRLEREVKYHKSMASFDFRLEQFLAFSAIFVGGLATVLAAIDDLDKALQAALTAVAPVFIAIQSRYRFADRADWHTRKEVALDDLLRQLQIEGKSPVEIDKALTAVEHIQPGRHPLAQGKMETKAGS